ncbi:MAG TPA: hypothetical protein VLF71_02160 [Candidatus Saccharimonadales bacterium]|nr:hypothetical protein [Candidatus Saccharimonadales bacterium]
MGSAVAEGFPFDAEADYRQTLADIVTTFEANKRAAIENGGTQAIIAGTAAARQDIVPATEITTEASVRLVIVRRSAGQGATARHEYAFAAQTYGANGEPVGLEDVATYSTMPSESDWEGRAQTAGVRHRNLLDAIRFDPLEAAMAMHERADVGGGAFGAGVEAGVGAERRHLGNLRHPRLARYMGALTRFFRG